MRAPGQNERDMKQPADVKKPHGGVMLYTANSIWQKLACLGWAPNEAKTKIPYLLKSCGPCLDVLSVREIEEE